MSHHRHKDKRVDRKLKRARDELPVEVEETKELLERVVITPEQEHLSEYVHMFHKLQRLIRRLERKILRDEAPQGRDVYALSTLYSQQREVIADIRTLDDSASMIAGMSNNVITPYTQTVTQAYTDVFYALRRLISEVATKDREFAHQQLETIIREGATAINAADAQARGAIMAALSPPDTGYSAKRKRR